jgi:hypothetical protein
LPGGGIDADGNITDVGIITMEMIEIGKTGIGEIAMAEERAKVRINTEDHTGASIPG